jgi:hypothetical protein
MLFELMAAQAAFGVIKEIVRNSDNLMNASQTLFQFFDSKAANQKEYDRKHRLTRASEKRNE